MRKYYLASIPLFLIVTTLSTIHSARIHVGSEINSYPFDGTRHAATWPEAVMHDLPSCAVEGLIAVGLFLGLAYASLTIIKYWKERSVSDAKERKDL